MWWQITFPAPKRTQQYFCPHVFFLESYLYSRQNVDFNFPSLWPQIGLRDSFLINAMKYKLYKWWCCVALKTFHNLSSFCSPPLPTYVSTLPPAPAAPDLSQFRCSSPPLLHIFHLSFCFCAFWPSPPLPPPTVVLFSGHKLYHRTWFFGSDYLSLCIHPKASVFSVIRLSDPWEQGMRLIPLVIH